MASEKSGKFDHVIIANHFSPNLYYFCWLGYFQIESVRISLPFEGYWRRYGTYQTFFDLSDIRIGSEIISLLTSPGNKKETKQHDVNLNVVKLTIIGI